MKTTTTFFEVIDRIREAGNVPTLPMVATKVMNLVAQADSTLAQIAQVIETDQALASRVLKVINSPAYGMREEVSSIAKAILLLGLKEIRNLTVGLSVLQMFPLKPGLANFDQKAFWNHCLSTGLLAKAMATKLDYNFDGEEYTAGLLHDIGKVLLEQYFHDEFVDAIQESRDKGIPLYEAEAERIGGSHQQVGAWLVKRWRLPASIGEVATHHHDPAAAKENKILTALVFMANIVAQSKGLGFGGNVFRVPLDRNVGWQIIQADSPLYSVMPFDHFIKELDDDIEEIRTSGSIF